MKVYSSSDSPEMKMYYRKQHAKKCIFEVSKAVTYEKLKYFQGSGFDLDKQIGFVQFSLRFEFPLTHTSGSTKSDHYVTLLQICH